MSQRLGHFKLFEKIGAGGMGVVYRAHDDQLDRDVAIKVLPAESFSDPTARARLLREARTASKLNHAHICTIHAVGEADGQAYIAMELVEGRPLSAILADGPLPADQVLRYGIQLADALAHAHQRGIIHRDVKSANVMISGAGRAKVLDFGLAKLVSREALAEGTTQTLATLTEAGAIVGTLPYLAPEQLCGQPAGPRGDIWALGVTLYEMAAGTRPFRGQTGFEVTSAILKEPTPTMPPGVPSGLRAVIERCLVKAPEERYQRAQEVLAALGAVAVVSVVPVVRERLLGRAETPKFQSLAVLPLANLSGDPQQDYLADGLHEALITDLAKLRGFRRVIARSSVMRYRNTDKPLRQIARELGIDAIITGSVHREGNRIRITAQLIRAATEEQLWAERYDLELRGVLSLQNDIVTAVTREVKMQLTPQERARLASARPVNPESHEAYLKGMFYLNKFTPEGTEKGLKYIQQAIEKDPAHPLPYARLALAYNEIGHGAAAPPDAFLRAKAAALKALELDGTLAEAHEALAEIKLYSDWGDWAGAEQAFRRALELNPNFAEAHRNYAWYLFLTPRWEEAAAELKRAQELDPLAPMWNADLAWQYWSLGRYDQALNEAKKSLELNPDFPFGLWMLGAAYAEKGMYKEAIAAQQRLDAAGPEWQWVLPRTYALAGRRNEAREKATVLARKNEPIYTWGLAEIYATLGDKDEAFRWLEAAYKIHWSWMPWISQNPAFKLLREDPRFENLLRRMQLPVKP